MSGFSFGAPSTTVAPTSTGGGFTFGGSAPTASVAAGGSVNNTGSTSFSFGAPASANTSASANVNNTASSTTTPVAATSTTTGVGTPPNATATVPIFEDTFPFLSIHHQIETILNSIHDYTSSDYGYNDANGHNDISILGQELQHLLSNTNASISGTHSANSTFGHLLSNPLQALQSKIQSSPNMTLRQQLQSQPCFQFPPSTDSRPHDAPTSIPPSMLHHIFQLSSNLQISEMDAASLYSVIRSSHTPNTPLQQHLIGSNTTSWFKERHLRPNSLLSYGFIDGVIQNAKDNGTYIQHLQQQQQQFHNTEEEEELLKLAMDLYFTERTSCLQTLLLLIQHRVSVYTTLLQNQQTNDITINLGTQLILESTDSLLNANLITHLISFIREMTKKNDEVEKKICFALDQTKQHQQSQNQQQTQQQSNWQSNQLPEISDVDYAMYEFTFRQRQLASQCLFYLTYHTQCNSSEITSLIDIVQDLTNGTIGSGLPILDAIRDVPDPYTLLWGNRHDGKESTTNQHNHAMQGISMTTPQQRKVEKGRVAWEHELKSSLMSAKGLMNATITSMRSDFSGQMAYYATPLRSIGNESITGSSMDDVGNGEKRSRAVIVGGGKPQLLHCVSTLILSIMCSLDMQNTLMDRNTHCPNDFGKGNALFPPQLLHEHPTEIHGDIESINERLDPKSEHYSKWKRQDIGGLLSVAYALLLRPSSSIFMSPTKSLRERSSSGGSTSSSSNSLYQIFRSCLEVPALTKSLTFARLSLIPSIGLPSMKSSSAILDNDFTFYISVLSDFTSNYLDAISSFSDLPISRAKWMEYEHQELQMQQIQEEQRRQLGAWSGQRYQEVEVPSEVDIFKRPDCIDDIIAMAVSVCSVYPECAYRFWSIHEKNVEYDDGRDDEHVVELQPSKIIRKLYASQGKDKSLLPVYLSFLEAISLCGSQYDESHTMNGANAVHELMSNPNINSSSTYGDESHINWEYILNSIRLYTNELNPEPVEDTTNDSWRSSGNQYDQTDTDDNQGYYYGIDSTSNYNPNNSDKATKSASKSSQRMERGLDEFSSRILLSFLSLISQVTFKSDVARKAIMAIRLPVPGSKRLIAVEDDVLSILFSLLVTPISSELRGMTLCAISNLIRCPPLKTLSNEEQKIYEDLVLRCWSMIEKTQILPTRKLSQYPLSSEVTYSNPYFSSSNNNQERNWFPPSEENGIIYEFEYIESKAGSYPATEGLLKLLTVLFSFPSCPSDLGSGERRMLGCSPYIEYVIDFILPRTMEVNDDFTSLYFNSEADKSRLLTRALEVVNSVLVGYTIPSFTKDIHQNEPKLVVESAIMPKEEYVGTKPSFGFEEMKSLTKQSLYLVHDEIFSQQSYPASVPAINDFEFTSVSNPSAAGNQQEIIPHAKSPGFYVLANILSSEGSLLGLLSQILMRHHSAESLGHICRNFQDIPVQITALFADIVPKYFTAKGSRDVLLEEQKMDLQNICISSMPSRFVETFMQPLFPKIIQEIPQTIQTQRHCDLLLSIDEICWKEHCALFVLKILIAAAGRNASFERRLNESNQATRLVPVMRFHDRANQVLSPVLYKNLKYRELSKLIIDSTSIFPLLIQYIGYKPTSLSNNDSLSVAAISLIKYVEENVQPEEFTNYLNGMSSMQYCNIAISFAERLFLAKASSDNLDISTLVLKQLASDVIDKSSNKEQLSHIILGLSPQSDHVKKEYLLQSLRGIDIGFCDYNNALDVLISLISDINFILEPKSSFLAAKSFEIIYRLCDNDDPNYQLTKVCIVNKLRSMNFWQTQLIRFMGKHENPETLLNIILSSSMNQQNADVMERDSDVMHCVSWIMKGVSLELHFLSGHAVMDIGRRDVEAIILSALSPQPIKFRELMSILFEHSSGILINTANSLPIQKPPMTAMLHADVIHEDIINACTTLMEGPSDVCNGYNVIDVEKLTAHLKEPQTEFISMAEKELLTVWSIKWNSYVNFSCASLHLCSSWRFLLQTAVTLSCQFANESLVDNSLIDILEQILVIHNQTSTFSSDRLDQSIVSSAGNIEYEPNNVQSLIGVCPMLVNRILASDNVDQADAQKIMLLLVEGIACCDSHTASQNLSNGNLVADLACALNALLCSRLVKASEMLLGPYDQRISSTLYKAANYLIKISIASTTMVSTEEKCHAQYCLASLLIWCDELEKDSSSTKAYPNHLVELFTPKSGIIAHCLELLSQLDEATLTLFESIAVCIRGTDILVNQGVSNALINVSRKFLSENRVLSRSTYGSVGIQVPNFLCPHFSLFNMMLSSNVSRPVQLQLQSDALEFLQMHSPFSERVMSGYPQNKELILNIMTMVVLISSTFERNERDSVDTSFQSQEWFIKLEHHFIDLSFHLAAYPIPAQFLNRLPKDIRNIQFSKIEHNKNEKCWWDAVPSGAENDIVLPAPYLKPQFAVENTSWTVQSYSFACSAAQIVKLCLFYLMHNIRTLNTANVEPLQLSIAICRYSDLIQATTYRLSQLQVQSENLLSQMLSSMQDRNDDISTNHQRNKSELDALEAYSTILINCFEKILYLSKEMVKCMALRSDSLIALKAAVQYSLLVLSKGNDPRTSFCRVIMDELVPLIT